MWFVIGFIILVLLLAMVTKSKHLGEAVFKYSSDTDEYIEPQVFSDVITEEEKKYILEKAGPMFARSSVVEIGRAHV